MADLSQLIKKGKRKKAKKTASSPPPASRSRKKRKKKTRRGPTRPWQENLEKYSSSSEQEADDLKETSSAPPKAPRRDFQPPPAQGIQNSNLKEPRRPQIKKSNKNQISNDMVTNKELISNDMVTNKELISNDIVTGKAHQQPGLKGFPDTINNDIVTNKELIGNDIVTNKELISNDMVTSIIEPNLTSSGFEKPRVSSSNSFAQLDDGIIGNELVTNKERVKELVSNELVTNKERNSNDIGTKRGLQKERSRNELVTKRNADNVFKFSIESLYALSTQKKNLMRFLHSMCVKTGSRVTPPLIKADFANAAGTTEKASKIRMKELEKSGWLVTAESKRGRGGYRRIELPEEVFMLLSAGLPSAEKNPINKAYSNEIVTKKELQRELQREREAPSKLVSNFKYTNYTKREELEEFYDSVNFALVQESDIYTTHGLSREKIIGEIAKNDWHIKPMDLDETLSKFQTYCSEQKNIYNVKNIRGFFFSQLKRLHKGEFLDIEGSDSSEIKRLKEHRQKQLAEKMVREDLKAEIIEDAFGKWWDETTDEVKVKISPQMMGMRGKLGDQQVRGAVKSEWMLKVWPTTSDYQELKDLFIKKD